MTATFEEKMMITGYIAFGMLFLRELKREMESE